MRFALFLAKNLHLSIGEEFCTFPCQKVAPLSPLLNGAEFTFSVVKKVALFEAVRIVRRIVCFCQMAWQGIESPKQTMETSFFSSKKWIKLIPKTIGNRKRDCAWGCARGIDTTWENLQIEKHKSGRRSLRSPDWFVLFDLQIFSGGVYPPSAIATSRSISFSISNSFWYYGSFTRVVRVCAALLGHCAVATVAVCGFAATSLWCFTAGCHVKSPLFPNPSQAEVCSTMAESKTVVFSQPNALRE